MPWYYYLATYAAVAFTAASLITLFEPEVVLPKTSGDMPAGLAFVLWGVCWPLVLALYIIAVPCKAIDSYALHLGKRGQK